MFFVILTTGHSQADKVLSSKARLVPKMLNYQGYLTDTLGIPINDSLDMTFKIYDAIISGNELWSETQPNVPVERGVFSVLLGSGTPIPDTVFTAGADRWLELTLEGPQTLSPRTRITAMGYAYTSTYADTAEYAKNAVADNDWVRGTPDSVLFTANYLGVARGGAGNMLYGDSVHTHTNLGVACTTGAAGSNNIYCTVAGGHHNIASGYSATVGGGEVNTASAVIATVGGGFRNTANGITATVGGGQLNTASGWSAAVAGGHDNDASGSCATVGGGTYNTASFDNATVGGGRDNTADSDYATVGGGGWNTASALFAAVGGGRSDTVNAAYGGIAAGYSNLAGNAPTDSAAFVGGGYDNSATARYATVGGGLDNTASGSFATVGGGQSDTVNAVYGGVAAGYSNLAGDQPNDSAAFVGGGYDNSATARYATVGGGANNNASDLSATVAGGDTNTASGSHATMGGGSGNTASGSFATISGGYDNTASGSHATVSGGQNNSASGSFATVGGGYTNTTSGWRATVGGGYDNTASDFCATVSGGAHNAADSSYTTVGGGRDNNASNWYTTVGGGQNNSASGSHATVGGGANNTASGWRATVGGGYYCESNGEYSFTVGSASVVPSSYQNSAAFNGQTATAHGQTRIGILSKASGSFTIDHPTEPMDRILNHYFVESPEMVLIYRGVAIIGSDGRAEVNLPNYFDALNRNPMVQLTGVGTSDVYVAEKVTGNRFAIGGKPETEVYWTITAERKDQSAEITRILMPVEQLKEGDLAGHSLDDDFLATTMSQLERMGQAGTFKFRTAEGQEKYERSLRAPEKTGPTERE
jgi:hypothetical protein